MPKFEAEIMDQKIIKVIVDTPLWEPLDYLNIPDEKLKVGERCLVPVGRRTCVGIVIGFSEKSTFPQERLKKIIGRIDNLAPLSTNWLRFTRFASKYYLSPWGETAVPSLPKFFRRPPGQRHGSSLERLRKSKFTLEESEQTLPVLNEEQSFVVDNFHLNKFSVSLLYGITGSGKTEVYLRLIQKIFEQKQDAQILLMVPEINLTPQLVERVAKRFPHHAVGSWNSKMSEGEKAATWLAAHEGRLNILVGTRLSVFASLPKLSLVLIDEEHDSSYKALEGVRYSSRDLAIKRGQIENIPVLLGSATPSFESFQRAMQGDYTLFKMTKRAVQDAHLPELELIDVSKDRVKGAALCAQVKDEITKTLERKEQVLIFLNRRGYAPVVTCNSCGWVSTCPHCSTFAVYHKTTGNLTCHYCGWTTPLPRHCPKCGSVEIVPLGRGTQRVEEEIKELWPEAKVMRLDQDSTRRKGSAQEVLESVHQGRVDILLGTQIVAKGHDFKKVSLVVILNSDPVLLSPDFRARERLFSVLMQVSGRAGRGEIPGRVLLQTQYTQDPLFHHLSRQNYGDFAAEELKSRLNTRLPPFTAQALIIAEGKKINDVLKYLDEVRQTAVSFNFPGVQIYSPIPQSIMRIQDIERGQLLLEADSKKVMQDFLAVFAPLLFEKMNRFNVYIDVDPLNC